MNRTRIVLGLTAMLTVFAITAATASAAQFTGGGGATHGESQLAAGTVATLAINSTAPPVISSKAPDTWKIQDSKTQTITKAGGHLDLEINFQEPTAAGNKVGLNNPLVLQVNGANEALISKEVVLSVPTSATKICTVTLMPKANEHLTKVTYTNVGANLELKSEVGGITNEAKPAAECATVGITAGKVGTFKSTSIEHGVTFV